MGSRTFARLTETEEEKTQLQLGQLYWSSPTRNLLVMFVEYFPMPPEHRSLIVPRCLVLARKNDRCHAPGKVVVLRADRLVRVSPEEASIPLALIGR